MANSSRISIPEKKYIYLCVIINPNGQAIAMSDLLRICCGLTKSDLAASVQGYNRFIAVVWSKEPDLSFHCSVNMRAKQANYLTLHNTHTKTQRIRLLLLMALRPDYDQWEFCDPGFVLINSFIMTHRYIRS